MTRLALTGGLLLLEIGASAVSASESTITSFEIIGRLALPALVCIVPFVQQAGDVLFGCLAGSNGEMESSLGVDE